MFYECLRSYFIEEENEWIIITSNEDNLSINNAKERKKEKGKKEWGSKREMKNLATER